MKTTLIKLCATAFLLFVGLTGFAQNNNAPTNGYLIAKAKQAASANCIASPSQVGPVQGTVTVIGDLSCVTDGPVYEVIISGKNVGNTPQTLLLASVIFDCDGDVISVGCSR